MEVVERPVPGDGEALVRVHAASVNDWDWQLLAGRPFLNRVNGAGGLRGPRHPIPGCDIAAVVVEVGAQVVEVAVGDEVLAVLSGCGFGAFAEFACPPAQVLRRKPAGLSWVEAAAVPQAGSLAVLALRTGGPVRPNQAVLVNGAGGGVGTFAVQIAASQGAVVTGVDRADKLETVEAVGARHVIDYTRTDFTRLGAVYDRIVEPVACRSPRAYRRALRSGGRVHDRGRVLASGRCGGAGRRPDEQADRATVDGSSVATERCRGYGLVDRPARDWRGHTRRGPGVSADRSARALQHFGASRHIGKIVLTME